MSTAGWRAERKRQGKCQRCAGEHPLGSVVTTWYGVDELPPIRKQSNGACWRYKPHQRVGSWFILALRYVVMQVPGCHTPHRKRGYRCRCACGYESDVFESSLLHGSRRCRSCAKRRPYKTQREKDRTRRAALDRLRKYRQRPEVKKARAAYQREYARKLRGCPPRAWGPYGKETTT